MLLSELLDLPVHGPDGVPVGYVIDVRFVLDGPPGPLLAAARLHGVLIHPRTRSPFLGYERAAVRAPWPIAPLLRRRDRGTFLVHWSDVARVEDGVLHLVSGYTRWSPALSTPGPAGTS